MNASITMVEWKDSLVIPQLSKKTAKLHRDKLLNVKNKYYASLMSKVSSNIENQQPTKMQSFGSNYDQVISANNLSIIFNGNEIVHPTGARKLKVNSIVRDGTYALFNYCVKNGRVVTTKIENSYAAPESFSNVYRRNVELGNEVPVAKATVATEMPVNKPYNDMASVGSMASSTGDTALNSSLSRVSRMDYTENAMTPEPKEEVHAMRTPDSVASHDNIVSIDDYLQHGKVKNDDSNIALLLQDNEKLAEEIDRSHSIMSQLEAQLRELQELRKARISALEEERLSKTATLNGLTEQIRALQEAIKKEQQSLNSDSNTVTRRVA